MKGYYLTGFYYLQDEINLSHHGSTSVGSPEWPSMSWSTDDLQINNVPGAPQLENTPD